MRRDFQLREVDRDYLERLGKPWEAVRDQGIDWLLIHGWPIPAGYQVGAAKVALQIPGGYPDAQIDMVYFDPPLGRHDGRGIVQTSPQDIAGGSFQRWSRHRTGENPWVAGEDGVETHMILVDLWLQAEVRR
ncbi:MAG: hypothetical protein JNM56_01060 [Planctomycetia bacterium]|nr:hypothetical protein [Planctomycetia bacterium]